MSTSQVLQKYVVKRAERIIGSEAVEGERVARLSWSRRQTALQFSGENLAAASFSLLFFFFYEDMTSARGQNQRSKFQFHSESDLLGQVYQFLPGTVCDTLSRLRLFV